MPKYQQDWTDKATGYGYRLQLLTHDTDFNTAATSWDGNELVGVGTLTREFDELPVGVMKPPSMNVTLAWSNLTSTEKGYLRNPTNGTQKNLWMFYVDYGSGYELEFAGVQADVESTKYTITPDGTYTVEYELVDVYWDSLTQLNSAGLVSACSGVSVLTTGGGGYREFYDVDFNSPSERADYFYSLRKAEHRCNPAALQDIIEAITVTQMVSSFAINYHHFANALDQTNYIAANPIDSIKTFPLTACTFYKANVTTTRTVGSALAASELLVPAKIKNADGDFIGGYIVDGDEYGISQYQSAYDWLRDLAENFAVKIGWTYEIRTTGGGLNYIGIDLWAAKIYGDVPGAVGSTIDITDDILKEDAEVEEGYAVIGKAETRWDGGDEDLTEIVIANNATRTQRSFNVQVKVHNLPRVKDNVTSKSSGPALGGSLGNTYNDAWTTGLDATNVLCFLTAGNALTKAHEDVRIDDENTATTYSVDESDDPPTGGFDMEDHILWCLTVQGESGLAYALASFYADRFGDRTQSLLTITMPLESYIKKYNDIGMGAIVNGISDLSHITTNNAQIIGHERNYEDGTQTLRLLLCP